MSTIFKPIFGNDWGKLPISLQKHYANRPHTNDKITVTGHLDVYSGAPIRFASPLFWLMRFVPPVNATNVPTTVHFESNKDNKELRFHRIFHFDNRKPYHFVSRMVQIKDNEVMEIMSHGFCWNIYYLWEDGKVILRHKGYALKAFGNFIPLPITWLLGRGDAEEWAIEDNSFEMCAQLTHPLFGKIYEYKGLFEFK